MEHLPYVFGLCVHLIAANIQVCEVANVHIENEDGSRHILELKQLEPFQTKNFIKYAIHQGQTAMIGNGFEPKETALHFNVVLPPGEIISACDERDGDLPSGVCSWTTNEDHNYCSKDGICTPNGENDDAVDSDTVTVSQDHLVEVLISRGLIPMATGDDELDHTIAHAVINLKKGQWDKTINDLTALLEYHPETVAAYYCRGVAFARKGLGNVQHALRSLADFTMCLEREPTQAKCYEQRAEVYISLNQFHQALDDLNKAIVYQPTQSLYLNRGIVNLLLENFADAESDFRKNLQNGNVKSNAVLSNFHLGLALYYQGKLRIAIEVFKEVLKMDSEHVQASISLAQAYAELGNLKAAQSRFNRALSLDPNNTLALQLQASMLYHAGDPISARPVLQHCLSLDSNSIKCQYLLALSNIALGQFFPGVKSTTKVIVNSLPTLQSTPEYMKALYLREYSRYLHASLDTPLNMLQPEVDFAEDLRSQWVMGLQFKTQGTYREQPGLQPEIRDVNLNPTEILTNSSGLRSLLCLAEMVGWSMQVSADGFLPNRRLNLAMGMAAIHIAQLAEAKWKNMKSGKTGERPFTWKEIFSVAVQYRRLVNPEQPVLWVSSLRDYKKSDGYRADITFMRGSVKSVRLGPYFDLAFKLARTMLEHYTGDGAVQYPELSADIGRAKSCEDLLEVARKRHINPHGFLVSTQVPPTVSPTGKGDAGLSDERLDGSVLVLTRDPNGQIVFALNIVSLPARTTAYAAQIDHFLLLLHQEVQRSGLNKLSEMDAVLNSILSLIYYFYNLMPLTRGSSVVAYAVMMGLVMSLGRQINGKVPVGKLLDMEAILAGAPDAFVLVTRQWLTLKKANTPLTGLPRVWEVLPTVRSMIEFLVQNTSSVCG